MSGAGVNAAESDTLDVLLGQINARLTFTQIVCVGTRTEATYVDMPLLRHEARSEFRELAGARAVAYDESVLTAVQRAAGGAFLGELPGKQNDPAWDEATAIDHCALDVERASEIEGALRDFVTFDGEDRRVFALAAGTEASLDDVVRGRLRANHAVLVYLAAEINDCLNAHALEPATIVSHGYANERWNGVGVYRLGYKPHRPGQDIHDEDEMNEDVDVLIELAERTGLLAFADEIDGSGVIPFEPPGAAPSGFVLLCDTGDSQFVLDELNSVLFEAETDV